MIRLGGISIALFTVWVFYIYSAERGSTAHSIVSRIRRNRKPPNDIESLPLRQWPASTSPSSPSATTYKEQDEQPARKIVKPKLAKTTNRSIERKRPIKRMCSKIEKNFAWQYGTLRGKSRLQSSLSTPAEESREPRVPLKISRPIVHPNTREYILGTRNFGDRMGRQEAKRSSEAAFRFAAQYKPAGTPISPGFNGGPSRRSITSPISFSPTIIKSPGAQSRSSIITWFRLHPGEKVL